MVAIEKNAAVRVFRIAFMNIGSILRAERRLRGSRQLGTANERAFFVTNRPFGA